MNYMHRFVCWLIISSTAYVLLVVIYPLKFERVTQVTPRMTVQKRVLILSQARSGSTLTSEIIQSRRKTYSITEPSFFLFHQEMRNVTAEEVVRYLEEVYKCNVDFFVQKSVSLDKRRSSWWQTWIKLNEFGHSDRCKEAEMIVIKTTGARSRFIWQWLQANSAIKVIQLVRDPRAIINSRLVALRAEAWINFTAAMDPNTACCRILNDVIYLSRIPQQILTVKYEDMIKDMNKTFEDIFNFIGLDMGPEVYHAITKHTNEEEPTFLGTVFKQLNTIFPNELSTRAKLFSTYRDSSSFNPDHWVEDLNTTILHQIQNDEACQKLMKHFGYEMV